MADSQEVSTIEVRDVTKTFGVIKAVDKLSFDIHSREVVGFLGPNGSGKTTTMRLITSYYTPDSGTILVDGVDTQEDDVLTRDRIGYLPENNPLYEDMTVNEYLNFVADLRGMQGQQRRANLDDAVQETALEEVFYRPIHELSKGYQQRVGIAQAILHQPELLILDEPTEGLDPNQRVPIRELIRTLGSERTVLLSTHVLTEVEATCDRIILIHHGRLVADDSVSNLLKRAQGTTSIHLEVEGTRVESGLKSLPGVESVQRLDPVDGRKRYIISASGEGDPRPDIFKLATQKGWVLWELHEEAGRLEDIFHRLTG